jgi:hypothetical protein
MPFFTRSGLCSVVFACTLTIGHRHVLAQAHHLAGVAGLPVGNGLLAGAGTAAMVHQTQMLKMFDRNGDGIIDPNEAALAQSGLGTLLSHHQGAGSAAGGSGNLVSQFDQNGNGQLDQVELELVQLMMLAFAGYNQQRPATGVMPGVIPAQFPQNQLPPVEQPKKKKRGQRGQRLADFAKPVKKRIENIPPPALPKEKAKARGPMVENDKPAKKPVGNQP